MRTRLMRTGLLTPILLTLLFVCTSKAFGQIDPSALYHITAKHSGKCLDVSGGAGAVGNGVRVIQWDCHDGDNQKWQLTSVGDGWYKIIAKHSGKGLDVFGGTVSSGNGVIVEQWDYNAGANQMWRLIPLGEDYYQIIARHSGKCLDITGGIGATENGAGAQQWDCANSATNQKWKLTSLSPRLACAADQIGSTLIGTGEMTATRVSSDPFPQALDLRVDLTQCRGSVRITNFPSLTTREFPTTLGPNTTTVTLTANSGSLDPARNMSVQVTLHFQHSLEMNPRTAALARPSDLALTLRGQVALNGDITLAGSGTFIGGYLNGSTGSLRVTGRLSPSP